MWGDLRGDVFCLCLLYTSRYGLAVTDPTGRIRSFIEKPLWPRVVTDFVNTGIYAVSPRVMELVPDGRAFDFGKALFPLLLRRGALIRGCLLYTSYG